MKKINIILAFIFVFIGIGVLAFGSIAPQYWTIRLAGVIIAFTGFLPLGSRIYERIKIKARSKANE